MAQKVFRDTSREVVIPSTVKRVRDFLVSNLFNTLSIPMLGKHNYENVISSLSISRLLKSAEILYPWPEN